VNTTFDRPLSMLLICIGHGKVNVTTDTGSGMPDMNK
jgi:hypothetical protein